MTRGASAVHVTVTVRVLREISRSRLEDFSKAVRNEWAVFPLSSCSPSFPRDHKQAISRLIIEQLLAALPCYAITTRSHCASSDLYWRYYLVCEHGMSCCSKVEWSLIALC